jgi:hypothetical protein
MSSDISTLATRKIGVTAKGRKQAPNLKRKLGLDDSSEDDNSSYRRKIDRKIKKDTNDSACSNGEIVTGDRAIINSMDHSIPMLPGANLLFKVQKKKNLTMSSKMGQYLKLDVTSELFQAFRKKRFTMDPLYMYRKNVVLDHVSDCQDLVFHTLLGHNILFHGVGDKLEFLNEFSHSFAGEDVLEIDGRDNPRHFDREEQKDEEGFGGVSTSSSIGQSQMGISQDLTVKALLRRINSLLGFGEQLPGIRGPVFDVVETARSLVESLELHYGQNSLGKYDSTIERVVLEHVYEVGRSLAPKPSAPNPSQVTAVSSSIANKSTSHSKESFKCKNENIIRRYIEANKPTNAEWVGASRYINSVSRLYIVVHSLDGDGLASPRSQEALAVLAACPSVSLIASCDNLNCPLLWTTEISSNFNWLYVNVTTYQPYDKSLFGSTIEAILHGDSKHTTNTYQNSQLFYKGITARQREVVCELIQNSLINKQSMLNENGGRSSNIKGFVPKRKIFLCGMLKSELFKNCKNKLIVNSLGELSKTLKELVEQNIVHMSKHSSDDSTDKNFGDDFVTINMTFDEMEQFLKTFAAK